MDIDQARQDILRWIQDFVETANPALQGWPPCPYARRARLEGKIDIRPGQVDPYHDLQRISMEQFDVIVLVYDPAEISAEEFDEHVRLVNQAFLVPRGLIALADHPDDPEIVNGVRMNQGQWALAFLQDLSKLNGHARELARRGFYQDWPDIYLVTLFEHRQDPRS